MADICSSGRMHYIWHLVHRSFRVLPQLVLSFTWSVVVESSENLPWVQATVKRSLCCRLQCLSDFCLIVSVVPWLKARWECARQR
eukprot:5566619-Amphidinium_carterae.1